MDEKQESRKSTEVPKFTKKEIQYLSEAASQYFQMLAQEVNQSFVLGNSRGVQEKIQVGKNATDKVNDWADRLTENVE